MKAVKKVKKFKDKSLDRYEKTEHFKKINHEKKRKRKKM